jgi:transposase, IS5 family
MRVARRTGRVPSTVTADRGYGQAAVEKDLHAAGVRTVAIPRQATTSAARKAIEHGRGFRKLVKWRTGCEGRISYLNTATAGTAPAWTAGTERRSGAGTGYSPTTWSRSGASPADRYPSDTRPAQRASPFPGSDFFRGK